MFIRARLWLLFLLTALSAVVLSGCQARGASGPANNPVFGMSAPEILGEPVATQMEQLKGMKELGVTSIRVDANWFAVQNAGPDKYDWASLDQAVASIQKAGLSADLIVDGCPPWAAVPGTHGRPFSQPAKPAEFGAWAGAVAARYGPMGVHDYEVWNEPNLSRFWAPLPDPAAYTKDLIAAYAAIKAADPASIVISGGLAPAANTQSSVDTVTFVQDMYADGAKGSFDGIGDHPYTYPDQPDSVTFGSTWSEMSQTTPSLRSLMTDNGDSAKKIWITEFGAPTSGHNAVSEAEQSAELVQAISQSRQISWIGALYIYTWSDQPPAPDGFGLLGLGNVQKPAFAAVGAALASK
jgi:hypothetical protein